MVKPFFKRQGPCYCWIRPRRLAAAERCRFESLFLSEPAEKCNLARAIRKSWLSSASWYLSAAFRARLGFPTTNSHADLTSSSTTTTTRPIGSIRPSNFSSLHLTTRHSTHGIFDINRTAAKRYQNHHIWKSTAHKRWPRCCSSWPSDRCKYVKALQAITIANIMDGM